MARKKLGGADLASAYLTKAELEKLARARAEIATAKEAPFESFPLIGTYCAECKCPQRQTPSGEVCENGHGGAPGLTRAEVEASGILPIDFPPDELPDIAPLEGPTITRNGVRIETIELETTRMIQIDGDLEEMLEEVDVRGAFVKFAPTIQASARSSVDLSRVADHLRKQGAIGVVMAPKVIRSETSDRVAAAIAKAPSPGEAVRAWFAELVGVPDDERKEAEEIALAILAEALAS